jgi:hypothetical protein
LKSSCRFSNASLLGAEDSSMALNILLNNIQSFSLLTIVLENPATSEFLHAVINNSLEKKSYYNHHLSNLEPIDL